MTAKLQAIDYLRRARCVVGGQPAGRKSDVDRAVELHDACTDCGGHGGAFHPEQPCPGCGFTFADSFSVEEIPRIMVNRSPAVTKGDFVRIAKQVSGVVDASVEEHADHPTKVTLSVIYRPLHISRERLTEAIDDAFRNKVPCYLELAIQAIEEADQDALERFRRSGA